MWTIRENICPLTAGLEIEFNFKWDFINTIPRHV